MKNKGNIDFRANTSVAPTKYRRSSSVVEMNFRRSSSVVEMNRRLEGVCNTPLQSHDIINMNGRIYDPITAQFMQADNYIQTPEDYIGYNRYSYCRHNPFKYTDPSGEMLLGEDPEEDKNALPMWSAGPTTGDNYESATTNTTIATSSKKPKSSMSSGGTPYSKHYGFTYFSIPNKKLLSPSRGFGKEGRQETVANSFEGLTSNLSGSSTQYGFGSYPTKQIDTPLITTAPIIPINIPKLTNPVYYPGFFGEQSITPNNPELEIFFTFTMAGDALLITKGIIRGVLEAAASRALRRESARLADEIGEWLGEGATKQFNKAGDPYFMSKGGLKKVRFDWNNTTPHDFKHMHFQELKNGKWVDAVKGKSQIGKW